MSGAGPDHDPAAAPWVPPDAPADDGPALVVAVPAPGAAATGAAAAVTTGAAAATGAAATVTTGAAAATVTTTAATVDVHAAPPSPPTVPELPVPLRPLSAGDRIDGALRILKLAPGPVLALAAAAVVPLQLLSTLALGRAGVDDGGGLLEAVLGRPLVRLFATDDGGTAVAAAGLVLLESVAVAVVACGLAPMVTRWYTDRRPTPVPELLRATARRAPAVVAAWMLVHAVELLFGLGLAVAAILPMAWFALTAPVIGAEGLGPIAAMRRSSRLARRALPTVVGTCGLAAAVDLGLRVALSAAGGGYADLGLPAAWAVTTAAGIGARLVTVPFVAGAAVLLHLDLRIRLEGLDIHLAADERFPRAS